jgi:hypothetical protein
VSETRYSLLYGTTKEGWSVGRDFAQDYCGEYYPVDSWHGTKILRPSYGPDYVLQIKLRVYSKSLFGRAQTKVVPTSWSASVACGQVSRGLECDTRYSRCRSVVEATRKAEAHPDVERLSQEVLRQVFRERRCVYRLIERGDLTRPEDWEPWTTNFNFGNPFDWPYGHYFYVYYDQDKLSGYYVDRMGGGYSGGTLTMPCPYPRPADHTNSREVHERLTRELKVWTL